MDSTVDIETPAAWWLVWSGRLLKSSVGSTGGSALTSK